MITLAQFTKLLEYSHDERFFNVYIDGKVKLLSLLIDTFKLSPDDFIKVSEKIKIKKLYPVADSLWVELDGVKIIFNSDDSFYFKYTCLDD